MKKTFLFLVFLFISVLMISCDDSIEIEDEKLNIELLGNDTIEFEEEIVYSVKIIKGKIKGDCEWTTQNDFLEIIEHTNSSVKVKGIKEGNETIYLNVDGYTFSKEIHINAKKIIYDDLSITGDNDVYLSDKIILSSNYPAVWTIKDGDCTINTIENGLKCEVEFKEVGVVTLTIQTIDDHNDALSLVDFSIKVNKDQEKIVLTVDGLDEVYINDTIKLTSNYLSTWELSNDNVSISVNDNECFVTGLKEGSCIIKITYNDLTLEKEIKIIKRDDLIVKFVNDEIIELLKVGEEKDFIIEKYNLDQINISYDNSLISISNNHITCLKAGLVTIVFSLKVDESITYQISFEIEEKKHVLTMNLPDEIEIGKIIYLQCQDEENNFYEDVKYSIDKEINCLQRDNLIIPVKPGLLTVTCQKDELQCSKTIIVTKLNSKEINSETDIFVKELMEKMTIEEKIGQMFVTGFGGTTVPEEIYEKVKQYHFGNFILFAGNTPNAEVTKTLINQINTMVDELNGIPAFISVDQEGGKIARITEGVTNFIGNMAVGQTDDYENSYYLGKMLGEELKYIGFTSDYAPVLDVNNNPNNPIIGVRSYGEDPIDVALFGANMIKGLKESGIMPTSKHFPGHGNTSTDTHLSMPSITSSKDELYKIELAPFICACNAGMDSIMTTHIVFNAIDKDNPATLSKKVLNDLLRNEIGYDGLIITDGMEMNAIRDNYGYDVAACLAVNASVDLLTTTSLETAIIMYDAILNGYKNKEISLETIDKAVYRILSQKYEYSLFNAEEEIEIPDYEAHNDFNNQLIKEILSKQNENMVYLDKSKPIYVVSTSQSRFSFESNYTGEQRSLAYYAYDHLSSEGYDITYKVVSNSSKSSVITSTVQASTGYSQIILAFDNVKSANKTKLIDLVNRIVSGNRNATIYIIALETPYDSLAYGSLPSNCYMINTYEYTKPMLSNLLEYLKGEK